MIRLRKVAGGGALGKGDDPEHDAACLHTAPPIPQTRKQGTQSCHAHKGPPKPQSGDADARVLQKIKDAAAEKGQGSQKNAHTYLRLNDLQVAHLDAAGGEVGDLELDLDRPLALGRPRHAAHAAAEAAHHAAAFVVVAAH